MIRRPPRSPRTDTLFPYPRSSDLLRVPRNPLALAGFGARGILPATWAGRAFRTEEAKAPFAGAAAPAFLPLSRPFTTALGIMLLASGHVPAPPSAKGASQATPPPPATSHADPARPLHPRTPLPPHPTPP